MTTTINTTSAEDARLSAAFGVHLGLGRNANAAEIKAAVVSWLTAIVLMQEQRALTPPDPIQPT